MVSFGNSSCTVMAIPSGAKSSKIPGGNLSPQVFGALSYTDILKAELSSLFVLLVVISSGNSLTILVLITYKLCNITVGLLGTTFRGFSDIEGN
ncbi:hypothetical protein LWI29_033931 [Acer saccharum]|uniref:Uncharacterized protein n=1 Tax=Acer saccharum TaxID=4024 RepID=A0AA39TP38_ACESA|nr:hypothetical protein LWI29_033931 [Acer saccharum]